MNEFLHNFSFQQKSHSKLANLEIVHQNKLDTLYGGQVFIKEEREPVINLSNVDLDLIIRNDMYYRGKKFVTYFFY